MSKIVLILHNIRSAHNVGAIFRSADGVGIGKVYLSGYTPSPIDRFGRGQKEIAKTALGAERTVPWDKRIDIGCLFQQLKEEEYEIVALEQDKKSINYKKYHPPKKVALIVGNEVRGLSRAVLNKCDKIIEIPMRGSKESLNVSVATAVALYQLLG